MCVLINEAFFSGAAFTRFQTMRLCKVFPADLADQLISYGNNNRKISESCFNFFVL